MALLSRNQPQAIEAPPATGRTLQFPPNFLWGVSTAAHQVEGGTGNNQWSAWEAAGRIKSGDRSHPACDWWNNAEADFDLAQAMGLNALRLSVEWSRIEPRPDEWDDEALQRYRAMLAGLHRRGILPIVCLHHFTHPRWFEDQGAFLNTNASDLFERFVRRVVNALGDLCEYWVTFNEPNVYGTLGYVLGEFPPGRKGEILAAIRVVNATARAHARAYDAIHQLQANAQVGWAHNYIVFHPARRLFPPDRWITGWINELFNESFLRWIEYGQLPFPLSWADGSASEAKGTCDFVGLNVYSRFHVTLDLGYPAQLFGRVYVPPSVPQGDPGVENPYGEAYPPAIRAAVERVARLKKPIYILENGVSDAQDRIRPWLLVNVIRELHSLLQEGYDLRGYFHWTLTDNFEWSEGWRLRFGLIALDEKTQQRTLRQSGRLYGAIARSNQLATDMIDQYFPGGLNSGGVPIP